MIYAVSSPYYRSFLRATGVAVTRPPKDAKTNTNKPATGLAKDVEMSDQ
jgi:hypothetical protein